jgi:hypothetical protein
MAETGVESRLANWPRRVLKLLAFAVLSVIVSFVFDKFTSSKGLEEMRNYQVEAHDNLSKIQPLALYYYFKASFGYNDLAKKRSAPEYESLKADCHKSGDIAMMAYLQLHLDKVRPVQNPDGTLSCLAAEKPSAIQNADKSPDATVVYDGMSECLEAYHAHDDGFRQCLASIPGPVSGWAAQYLDWIGDSNWTRISIVKLAFSAVSPALALADVVWHNYFNLQPGALFIWLLLAFGFIVSLSLLNAMKVGDEGLFSFFVWLALLPVGTVAISSLMALAFQYVAFALVYGFGGFINGVGIVVDVTSGFMLLQFSYLTLLKVVENAGHNSLHHWLVSMFSWLA